MKKIYETPMLLDVQEIAGADICATCGNTKPAEEIKAN